MMRLIVRVFGVFFSFLLLFSVFAFSWFLPAFSASQLSSERFTIQGGSTSLLRGPSQPDQIITLADLVGDAAATFFSAKGYLIQSGLHNRAASSFGTFSLSPSTFPLVLSPSHTSETQISYSIKGPKNIPYKIMVILDHPLSSVSGKEVLDTTCDFSRSPCTPYQSGIWSNDSTWGIGYRLSGLFAPVAFHPVNSFRSFASSSRGEFPALLEHNFHPPPLASGSMTLRVRPAPTFSDAEVYNTAITFSVIFGI